VVSKMMTRSFSDLVAVVMSKIPFGSVRCFLSAEGFPETHANP
jgi:hypothetical protein